MEQSIHRKGLVNWLLLLGLGVAWGIVAVHAHSATGLVGAVFVGLGFLVSAVSYFQMRLEYREQLERMESDEARQSASSQALFAASEALDVYPARRACAQFERYVVPGFALLLFLAQSAAVYLLWKHLRVDQPATLAQAILAMALNALFALVLFQFGKYAAVLARLERQRLLRPQASYLLLGALLALVTAVVEAAGWAGYPGIDAVMARILVVVLGLVALESILALVFEIYRPRVKGVADHPLYESRLIGLLSQPGGLITTAAQALDYQFGFKVSETWFYRFLERALAWLVLGQAFVLLASTCLVFVEPGEQALLERFGHPVAGRDLLGPGLHLKWPWPIDRIERHQTDRLQQFVIGHASEAGGEGSHAESQAHAERVMIWAKSHVKDEALYVVASRAQQVTNTFAGEQTVPVNLLSLNVPVQYQIRDLRAFAYNHANGTELLERLASAEVTRYLVSIDLNDIMTVGRLKAAEDLRQRIQARADKYKLGVRIRFVGLHEIHPPVKVAPDFEKVIGALQEREATNLYARAYMATNLPVARGQKDQRIAEARAYQVRTVAAAQAAAERFGNQIAAAAASPEVYRLRSYLDTVGRAAAGARTYILGVTNVHGVVTLNLEDKLRKDILDVMLPAKRE
jgi:regulator of protease activity HflC (stomatin/prohibitin superfamily)